MSAAHEKLLYVRLAAILIMGALSVAAAGLAGRALRQLHNNTVFVADLGKQTGFPAKLHAGNVVAALACTCTAAGLGVILAFHSEIHWYRERKKGTASLRTRLWIEIALAICALFMLGSLIPTTIIVMTKSGVVSGVPAAIQAAVMKSTGKSTRYRDYLCYQAMIVAWVCFGFYVIVLALTLVSAFHYRKQARLNSQYDHREEKTNGHHHIEA